MHTIVETTEGVDPVTQDMVIEILHDEQGHRRLFEGFLREYERERERTRSAAYSPNCLERLSRSRLINICWRICWRV